MFLRMFLMDWSLEIGHTLFRYRGIPKNAAKLFFTSADFPKLITFSFLNIFQKFQKEALEEIRGNITCFSDFSILAIFESKNLKKEWCFSSNAPFWIFWKMLRNKKVKFWKIGTCEKKVSWRFWEFPYIGTMCDLFQVTNPLRTS